MAFKISAVKTFWWPVWVELPVDGGRYEKQSLDIQFKKLSQEELEALQEKLKTDGYKSDMELARELVTDWKGIVDAEGAEIPFSINNRDQIVFKEAGICAAIVTSFFSAIQGAKRKN